MFISKKQKFEVSVGNSKKVFSNKPCNILTRHLAVTRKVTSDTNDFSKINYIIYIPEIMQFYGQRSANESGMVKKYCRLITFTNLITVTQRNLATLGGQHV